MTQATKPTSVNAQGAGGRVSFPVDDPPSLKNLSTDAVSINGTNYTAFVDQSGAAYVVPTGKNLQIYSVEQSMCLQNTTQPSVNQIGYDDDGAGTNFVKLIDIINYAQFISSLGTKVAVSGFAIGNQVAPAGKHLVMKMTNTATTYQLITGLIGLETL